MEKRIRRIEIIVFVILTLVVVNFITALLGNSNTSKAEVAEVQKTKELPSEITREYLDKVVYKVKTDFNRSNWEGVYDIFGEYSKAQFSVNEVSQEFSKLKTAIGNINTYAYSHYVYEGDGNSAEWFEIHYKCRFDNGKGNIKVSTRTADNVTEVVGLVINLDEI